MLPRDVDNLLVPVCMSTTHVAWGAVRLEPVWMQTGEAAGWAAALAKRGRTVPGKLDSDLLLRTLCEHQQLVSFFNDVTVTSEAASTRAAEYFGTRGFFHDYNARLDQPLKEPTARLWAESWAKLQAGEIDATALARRTADADAGPGSSISAAQFAELMPKQSKAPKSIDPAAITRGEALEWMWGALP